jgi:hypothetical protein
MAAKVKKRGAKAKGGSFGPKIRRLQGELAALQDKDQKSRFARVSKADLDVYYRVWSVFHHDAVAGAHATRCKGCHNYDSLALAGRGRFAKLGG